MRKVLKDTFAKNLKDPVVVMIFTQEGQNDQYNAVAVDLLKEMSEVDGRIKVSLHKIGDAESKKYNVMRSPTVLIGPDKYNIRFTGAPLGEEGRTLIMSLIMASNNAPFLTPASIAKIKGLNEKREVMVFVSPSCPYCPQQSAYAVASAVARPGVVGAEIIEIYENRDIAEELGAMSVPKTFINSTMTSEGLEPEERFIESLIAGGPAGFMAAEDEGRREFDLVILGGGPAGLTAAIYAGRSGLDCIVLEKSVLGGQIALTPVVENYTGFPQIAGKTLVELMAQQAMQYAPVMAGIGVQSASVASDGLFEVNTTKGVFKSKALILATGASNRKLNVPGEKRLAGRGVSYCATCDGYMFKDKRDVIVVGGGNSALTDALYLDSIGAKVTIAHRSGEFKAEAHLKKSLVERKIPVLYNHRVKEINGERVVKSALLEDVNSGASRTVKTDAVFIAIGYDPNIEIATMLGLKMTADGYIWTDPQQRTSMPFVFAAGDVTGGVKQITVAVGQGSVAAITAFEDMTEARRVATGAPRPQY